MRFFSLLALAPAVVSAVKSQQSQQPYSTWMLESIIARDEGIHASGGLLAEIQKGLFQQALRAAINQSDDPDQRARWADYHARSVEEGISQALSATDAEKNFPIDRLCLGRSIMELDPHGPNDQNALQSLRESVQLQPRNKDDSLWYFTDPQPPNALYGQAPYSDGMYGFVPYATLWGILTGDQSVNLEEGLKQAELLYHNALDKPTALIRHGYDPTHQAPWADNVTGASPLVWGRSMAWYTVGIVDALEIASTRTPEIESTPSFQRMRALFQHLAMAEVAAIENSARKTGRHGIWQVATQPGASVNFAEGSASALVTYALAKGARLGYLPSLVADTSRAMYWDIIENFVSRNGNGTLDYTGTSAMASLHQSNVTYEYYVGRERTTNSLIGTSAFALASLEIERMGTV